MVFSETEELPGNHQGTQLCQEEFRILDLNHAKSPLHAKSPQFTVIVVLWFPK